MNITSTGPLRWALGLGWVCGMVAPSVAQATPAPVWLVGVWDGWGVVCARVLRDDGEPVSVVGIPRASVGQRGTPVRLQGHYVAQSPCQETRQTFVLTVQP